MRVLGVEGLGLRGLGWRIRLLPPRFRPISMLIKEKRRRGWGSIRWGAAGERMIQGLGIRFQYTVCFSSGPSRKET